MGWSCCSLRWRCFFWIFLKTCFGHQESSIIFLPAEVCFDSSSVYRVSTGHVHICTLMSYVSQAALVTPPCVHERLLSGTERGQFWQRNWWSLSEVYNSKHLRWLFQFLICRLQCCRYLIVYTFRSSCFRFPFCLDFDASWKWCFSFFLRSQMDSNVVLSALEKEPFSQACFCLRGSLHPGRLTWTYKSPI